MEYPVDALGPLELIAAGFPMMLIGARLGHYLAVRIDQRRFNLGLGVLLLAIGTGLVFK